MHPWSRATVTVITIRVSTCTFQNCTCTLQISIYEVRCTHFIYSTALKGFFLTKINVKRLNLFDHTEKRETIAGKFIIIDELKLTSYSANSRER